MAWIKVSNGKRIPPIPVGVTYSNDRYFPAIVQVDGRTYNMSVVINTKKAKTLTISLYYGAEAYASGSSGSWHSSCGGRAQCDFIVNGVLKAQEMIDADSPDNGRVTKEKSMSIVLTDLPKGECTFQYNMRVWASQNGEQLDPHFRATYRWSIIGVT